MAQHNNYLHILRMLVLPCLLVLTVFPAASAVAEPPLSTGTDKLTHDLLNTESPKEPAATPDSAPAPAAPFDALLKRKGSLMFPRDKLDLYYQALSGAHTDSGASPEVSVEGGAGTGGTPEAAKAAEIVEKPVSKPIFYLGSVVYLLPESWSIWLNGKRIRIGHEAEEESLKVLNVNRKQVEFIWQSLNLDKVSPGWQKPFLPVMKGTLESIEANKKMPATPEEKQQEDKRKQAAFQSGDYHWDYKSPDGKILVDSTNGIVKFTLAPHQTFISEGLSIAEGQKSFTAAAPAAAQQAASSLTVEAGIPASGEKTRPEVEQNAAQEKVSPKKIETFDDILNEVDNKQ